MDKFKIIIGAELNVGVIISQDQTKYASLKMHVLRRDEGGDS